MAKMKDRTMYLTIDREVDGAAREHTFPFQVPEDYDGAMPEHVLERLKENVNRLTDSQLASEQLTMRDQMQMLRQINKGEYVVMEGDQVIYDFTETTPGPTLDGSNPNALPEGLDTALLAEYNAKVTKYTQLKDDINKMLHAAKELKEELQGMQSRVAGEATRLSNYYAQMAKAIGSDLAE